MSRLKAKYRVDRNLISSPANNNRLIWAIVQFGTKIEEKQ